jgi:hypothetical protein
MNMPKVTTALDNLDITKKAKRRVDDGRRRAVRWMFPFWQKLGFHVTAVHYEGPIPDTRTLKEELWEGVSEMPGVDLNEPAQLGLLESFTSKFRGEYDAFPRRSTGILSEFHLENGSYKSVDAEILYCMVRHFKPARIFEIGSGYSTLLTAQAIRKNQEEAVDYECRFVAFEPYPNAVLQAGVPGLTQLAVEKVQDVPITEFLELEAGDILFIDSSHVLTTGSDVAYEYLEILPRLNWGVIVHIHDIFAPAEYPREWVLCRHRFLNEQYLLQSFLAFNEAFEVLWAGSYMHLRHPGALKASFSSYRGGGAWPGGFWMRRIG